MIPRWSGRPPASAGTSCASGNGPASPLADLPLGRVPARKPRASAQRSARAVVKRMTAEVMQAAVDYDLKVI